MAGVAHRGTRRVAHPPDAAAHSTGTTVGSAPRVTVTGISPSGSDSVLGDVSHVTYRPDDAEPTGSGSPVSYDIVDTGLQMTMVMNASESWDPRGAARSPPITALLDSAMPLVSFHLMVAPTEVR